MKLLALVAVLVGGFLRVTKDPAFMESLGLPTIPKKYVPLVALVLGALSLGVNALVAGKAFDEALVEALTGLFAGAGAVAGHQVVVEGLRGGKELGE